MEGGLKKKGKKKRALTELSPALPVGTRFPDYSLTCLNREGGREREVRIEFKRS